MSIIRLYLEAKKDFDEKILTFLKKYAIIYAK